MSQQSLDDMTDVVLLDETTVSLRRLDSDDFDAILALHETLTDDERYRRFFTWRPAHLEAWARCLTERSDTRYALGAFDNDALIGVANYIATAAPGQAEVAVVVAHREHMRGVGTALLRQLGTIAKSNGVVHLVAEILAENHPMLTVITDAGWPCTRHLDGSELHIDVDLGDFD